MNIAEAVSTAERMTEAQYWRGYTTSLKQIEISLRDEETFLEFLCLSFKIIFCLMLKV